MTVTLELKPEIEARVTTQAARHNLSVEKYIQMLLENLTASPAASAGSSATPEQKARSWEEWVEGHDYISAPPILDDSRESIYREREDSQL